MSGKEKEALLAEARHGLQEEYQTREAELCESHREELAAVREKLEGRLDHWSREFEADLARERHVLAVDAAGLAVALARKIIRDTVAVDREVVVRTLETALYKAQDSHPLTAILNPADAEYLENKPDLLARLRIAKVVSDRRVEMGGCRVRAGSREWDATLTRQVDTLAAIVEETLAAGETDLVNLPGETDDSGLD
ncbi:MAG: FliH/SctL family protein [Candidatus Krumholzibacteriota bacterium]